MSKKPKDLPNEDVKQAVIFAQSFDPGFGPLCLNKPKILLPLVNRPMLAYTLEMLARAGIEEVFIFCNQYQTEIQAAVQEFHSKSFNKAIMVQVFVREEYNTLGNSMRDLDTKGLIKGHFVLLFGDCVGNLDLLGLIDAHSRNIKKDSGCVMTTIFRRANPNHRIRHNTQETILLLDNNGKIDFYGNFNYSLLQLPKDVLGGNNLSLHYDLLDTFVSVCSNKVPPDFSDNFDYETRNDFLHGLLANVELLQHHVYAHILDNQYASRVINPSTYDSISRDIIQRFTHPIVVDNDTECSYRFVNNNYLHNEIKFVDKSGIRQNSVVGAQTSMGTNCNITDSVIGDNVQIGSHVTIEGAYIWDGVTIGDGCIIRQSIIASGVQINPGCNVESGSLIAENVVLAKSLPENSYLLNDPENGNEEEAVGKGGKGQAYSLDDDYDSDDDEPAMDFWGNKKGPKDDDVESVSTTFDDSGDEDQSDEDELQEYHGFFKEVLDSLTRGVKEKLLCENLILEINASKHAWNVPIKEVNTIIVKAILSLASPTDKGYLPDTLANLKYTLWIIQNYLKSTDSQVDGIYSIEEFYLENEASLNGATLTKILHYFYNQDIFDEDIILTWFKKRAILPDFDDADQQRVRDLQELKPFITWLQEAEEESSDDEDSD